MKKRHKIILALSCFFLFVCLSVIGLAKEERGHNGDNGRKGKYKSQGKKHFMPVTNLTYQNTCGGCHFVYPSCLLPSESWSKILNRLKEHFGEEVPCEAAEQKEISKYLKENGADRPSGKRSAKIMKSLKGTTPLRITEVPYIRDKHRKISNEVLNRKAIGSLSNCLACHKTANQGNFDDHSVVIPE